MEGNLKSASGGSRGRTSDGRRRQMNSERLRYEAVWSCYTFDVWEVFSRKDDTAGNQVGANGFIRVGLGLPAAGGSVEPKVSSQKGLGKCRDIDYISNQASSVLQLDLAGRLVKAQQLIGASSS